VTHNSSLASRGTENPLSTSLDPFVRMGRAEEIANVALSFQTGRNYRLAPQAARFLSIQESGSADPKG
jgi:hypothetical protein